VLQGILFVFYTGVGWEDLPQEVGFGSGMTCWRRLRDWTEAGVFDRLHQALLAELMSPSPPALSAGAGSEHHCVRSS
jgi:transposase